MQLAGNEPGNVGQETLVLPAVGVLEVGHVFVEQLVDDILLLGVAAIALGAVLQSGHLSNEPGDGGVLAGGLEAVHELSRHLLTGQVLREEFVDGLASGRDRLLPGRLVAVGGLPYRRVGATGGPLRQG